MLTRRAALFKQSWELEAQGVPKLGKQTWATMGPHSTDP